MFSCLIKIWIFGEIISTSFHFNFSRMYEQLRAGCLNFQTHKQLRSIEEHKMGAEIYLCDLVVLDKKPHSRMKPKEIQPKVIKFQYCVLELF